MYYLLQKTFMTNDGFGMAWQNLVDRCENKRVLANSQLKAFFNLPSTSKELNPL